MGKTSRLGLAADYSMLRLLTEGVHIIQIKNIIKKDHCKIQTFVQTNEKIWTFLPIKEY